MLDSDELAIAVNDAIIRAGMVSIVLFIGCFAACLGSISLAICRYGRVRKPGHVHKGSRTRNHSRDHARDSASHTRDRERARGLAERACDIAIRRLDSANRGLVPDPSAPSIEEGRMSGKLPSE